MIRFVTISQLYQWLTTCQGPVSVILNGHRWTYNDPQHHEGAEHLGVCALL